MRKTGLIMLSAAIFVACATTEKKQPEPTQAEKLITRLDTLIEKGIMIGHQDDTFYGGTWHYEDGRSDVLETCGDYPAIMGFDLGKLELDSATNIDGVPVELMKREIVAQYERGGIVTISWHPWNPVTGENSWDPSGEAVTKILSGKGEVADTFNVWLDRIAAFIGSLETASGEKVPIIFRPWHEMSGHWFWWGCNSCTPEEYQKLYILTYNHLVEAGLGDNIVWAYSPNLANEETVEAYLQYYPGDEYVDLIGIDVYRFGSAEDFQYNLRKELDVVKAAAEQTGKIPALTETGFKNMTDSTWFTQCLLPVLKEYKLSYVLQWRNAWDKPEENYFMVAPELPCADDFRAYYADPHTLFVKDIRE